MKAGVTRLGGLTHGQPLHATHLSRIVSGYLQCIEQLLSTSHQKQLMLKAASEDNAALAGQHD